MEFSALFEMELTHPWIQGCKLTRDFMHLVISLQWWNFLLKAMNPGNICPRSDC
jgi:hypothetical protein